MDFFDFCYFLGTEHPLAYIVFLMLCLVIGTTIGKLLAKFYGAF